MPLFPSACPARLALPFAPCPRPLPLRPALVASLAVAVAPPPDVRPAPDAQPSADIGPKVVPVKPTEAKAPEPD